MPQKESTEEKVEEGIDKITKELDIKLPEGKLPPFIKLIALFTLAGGLSISGSTLADFLNPAVLGIGALLVRFITGILFIAVAYGIFERRMWAVWLYAALVILGVFLNFGPAVLIPAAMVLYLLTQRRYFKESIVDALVREAYRAVAGLRK